MCVHSPQTFRPRWKSVTSGDRDMILFLLGLGGFQEIQCCFGVCMIYGFGGVNNECQIQYS